MPGKWHSQRCERIPEDVNKLSHTANVSALKRELSHLCINWSTMAADKMLRRRKHIIFQIESKWSTEASVCCLAHYLNSLCSHWSCCCWVWLTLSSVFSSVMTLNAWATVSTRLSKYSVSRGEWMCQNLWPCRMLSIYLSGRWLFIHSQTQLEWKPQVSAWEGRQMLLSKWPQCRKQRVHKSHDCLMRSSLLVGILPRKPFHCCRVKAPVGTGDENDDHSSTVRCLGMHWAPIICVWPNWVCAFLHSCQCRIISAWVTSCSILASTRTCIHFHSAYYPQKRN